MLPDAPSVILPSDSYARIRNSRVLFGIRAVTIMLFVVWTVVGLLNLPADFQIYRLNLLSQVTWLKDLTGLGISIDTGIVYHWAFHILQVIIITAVGLLIFLYRSDDWYAILFSLCLTVSGVGNINYGTDFQSPIINFSEITIFLFMWLPVFPILCLFPNGRFIPRWSRWLLIPSIIIVIPNLLIKFGYWQVNARLSVAFFFVMALSWCFGIFLLLLRLRQTPNPINRQQIKVLFSGVFGAIVVVCFGKVLPLIPIIGSSALITLILDPLIYYGGQIGFGLLMTFAILRYHLWDIDLVLNRSSVYIGLAVVLILIFSSVLLLLQAALQGVLGSQQTIVAAMISAGVVVGAFNPVRQRLQRALDWQLFGGQIAADRLLAMEQNRSAGQLIPVRMPTDSLPGSQVGDYKISKLLGRGGMGEVYLGTHVILKRQVAVKVLLPHLATDPEFRARFEREASIVARLRHPNIITIFTFGENAGLYYMVMDYIQGPDLGTFLKERQILSLAESLPLIAKIASALDYAHGQGVAHRDIKPANIMLQQASLTESPQPILMDFGLTKLVDSNSSFTQSGPLGTLAYMAPEQIASAREVDHRADIYAFGVMCYQMLTGKLPFYSNNQAALLFAHLHKPAPDPRLIQPELSQATAAAILRALDKLPNNRPQSAGQFVTELSAIS